MTAALDYRHQCPGVCVIKSWYAEQSHISELLVVLLEKKSEYHCARAARSIALRDGKLLFPSMSLLVGRDKGVGHLLLLRPEGLRQLPFTCGISVSESSEKTRGSCIGAW